MSSNIEIEAIKVTAKEILKKYPKEVKNYKNGKTGLIGFFMGQLMKEIKGKADPKQVNALLSQLLEEWTIDDTLIDESSSRSNKEEDKSVDFIRAIINEDIRNNKHNGRVHTRFPPEPNGYLHIGHAKAICLSFGITEEYKGALCNLRFDDTNPTKESTEYTEAIKRDIQWLGYDWGDRLYYASDYFEKLYNYAEQLIKDGKAYVCSLTPDQMREYRGTPTEPGKNSPDRDRPIKENLDLFRKMKNGEFPDGKYLLRAKINMASPNMNMRDPAIYRIRHVSHHRTGGKWCIYPMYDFTHCLSDSIERITHSLCSLEFEDHRLLYDWFLDELNVDCHPQQIEFARLNLNYTIMSKRKLLLLVENGYVTGWDDPRMPTISGFRRRGYTPNSIRTFCDRIGVAKRNNTIDIAFLEHCLREDLENKAPRVMGVIDPVKLVITNYPEDKTEKLSASYHPDVCEMGERKIPFSRNILIDKNDFMENPPQDFHRLAPGKEVRLRYAYIIQCNEIIKDNMTGEIKEIHCTYDPDTRSGEGKVTRKVKGTLHWVNASCYIKAEARLYNHLFSKEDPDDTEPGKDFLSNLNKESLIVKDFYVEESLHCAKKEDHYQFERLGYFCVDNRDSKMDKIIFNRTVTLRDSWSKAKKQS